MMKNKDRVLDDIARVAGVSVSVLSGITQNIREDIKSRVDEMTDRMDLVPREDFEALEFRVKALEETLEKQNKKPVKKPIPKKK